MYLQKLSSSTSVSHPVFPDFASKIWKTFFFLSNLLYDWQWRPYQLSRKVAKFFNVLNCFKKCIKVFTRVLEIIYQEIWYPWFHHYSQHTCCHFRIRKHNILWQYADDIQLYISAQQNDATHLDSFTTCLFTINIYG